MINEHLRSLGAKQDMSIEVASAEDKARLLRALHTLGGPPPGFKFWWSYQWPFKVVSRRSCQNIFTVRIKQIEHKIDTGALHEATMQCLGKPRPVLYIGVEECQ